MFDSKKRKYNFATEVISSQSNKSFKKEGNNKDQSSLFTIDLSKCQDRSTLIASFSCFEESSSKELEKPQVISDPSPIERTFRTMMS